MPDPPPVTTILRPSEPDAHDRSPVAGPGGPGDAAPGPSITTVGSSVITNSMASTSRNRLVGAIAPVGGFEMKATKSSMLSNHWTATPSTPSVPDSARAVPGCCS